MNKFLKLGLMALLGSVMMAAPAKAAVFAFDVPSNPPSPASGSWRVTLTTTDFISWTQTTVANGIPNVPNFAANSVEITLWSSLAPLTAVAPVAGSTTHSPAPGGGWTFTALPSTSKWDHSPLGSPIPTDGSDFLGGSFSVANDKAKFVTISVQGDATSQWFLNNAVLVPEPASMTLAAAGLAPLAGLLKRRRRSSETAETEETEETA